jgi:hypothetical protein
VLDRQTAAIRFDSHLAVPADERNQIVRVVGRSLILWQYNIINYNQLYIYSFCGSILEYIQRFRRNLHCLQWHTLLPNVH